MARSQSRATLTPEEGRVGCGGCRRLEQPRTEHRGAEAAGAKVGMGKELGGAGRGGAGLGLCGAEAATDETQPLIQRRLESLTSIR